MKPRTKRQLSLVVSLVLLCPAELRAEPASMFGVGAAKCAQVSAISGGEAGRYIIQSWSDGWMSAVNWVNMSLHKAYADLNDPTFSKDVRYSMLLSICKNNPEMIAYDAIIKIYYKLPILKYDPNQKLPGLNK
ncbi:hypothetical protein [Asaia lannensis]|uniref:hypothetical protein n=1 Tax=Asaia lannensis TaxID=415421 RepID=UPI003872C928